MKWLALALVGACYAQIPAKLVSKIRIPADGGPLYATIGQKETKISNAAAKAWLLFGGRTVAYSAGNGAGGFENEGQALYFYDASSGRKTKILSESFEITAVSEAKSASGKTALLVSMEDGGLGASHIAVVDPSRGKVFHEDGAKFAASGAGGVTVKWYKDDDWEKLESGIAVKAYKTRRYDLDELLRRKVIPSKP
jgi:hypothetical protein